MDKPGKTRKKVFVISAIAVSALLLHSLARTTHKSAVQASPSGMTKLHKLIKSGSAAVWNENNEPLLEINAKRMNVPASILKIITAAAFLQHFELDYRFPTIFCQDAEKNLYIKGFGDPFLVSEEWASIADELFKRGVREIKDIYLDDLYFDPNIMIPGIGDSTNPFDAHNGALSTNFNTINVIISSDGKTIRSAEPQTPLTPFIRRKALSSGKTGRVRINIHQDRSDILKLTGSLASAFFSRSGIMVRGKTREGKTPNYLSPVLVHRSSKTAAEILEAMMKFSNNFIANQLFLILGAKARRPPATLEKSVNSVKKYVRDRLEIEQFNIVEGSGISRKNLISAESFGKALADFRPYYKLLPQYETNVWAKTGTLSNVKNLAGYFVPRSDPNKLYSFVIMLRSWRNKRDEALELLRNQF